MHINKALPGRWNAFSCMYYISSFAQVSCCEWNAPLNGPCVSVMEAAGLAHADVHAAVSTGLVWLDLPNTLVSQLWTFHKNKQACIWAAARRDIWSQGTLSKRFHFLSISNIYFALCPDLKYESTFWKIMKYRFLDLNHPPGFSCLTFSPFFIILTSDILSTLALHHCLSSWKIFPAVC